MEQSQIDNIVKNVMATLKTSGYTSASASGSRLGIFDTMEEALAAAQDAYIRLKDYSIEQKEAMIAEIRKLCRAEAETLAKMGVEETGMGNVLHKTLKHRLVADKTPGTEDLQTTALTGDGGLTLIQPSPFGLVGAITPCTNPSETVICNSIGMIAAGNAVVFNPHPKAVETSNYAIDLVNRGIRSAGGPENLVCGVKKPTMETSNVMVKHPDVKLLVATGGPGVVRMLLSSGKKAIGAGAGNPPVVVDETADIPKAAKDIIDGCTFDNNLPCIAEKEVFAVNSIADELIHFMLKNGAYMLDKQQAERLAALVMTEKGLNRDCVGKSAKHLLQMIGGTPKEDTRCLIYDTEFDHLFVQTELMMPILPIVRCADVDEAIELGVKAEHGNRHSAHMHSKNVDNLTKFARLVGTTIFVKNAPSYAGIGFQAEGHTTFTIAGPTGEGITSARSFTRQRRCVMSEAFSIV